MACKNCEGVQYIHVNNNDDNDEVPGELFTIYIEGNSRLKIAVVIIGIVSVNLLVAVRRSFLDCFFFACFVAF